MDRTDVVDAVALALSVLAVVAQATVVVVAATALLGLVWAPARGLLREVAEGLRPGLLWGAWGVAALATAGSLFFSEYAKFVPCGLCWYQRIAMYPLSVILLIAAVRRDYAAAARFGLPLVAFGAAVSVWHNYVERHPEAETGFCSIGGTTSCAVKWIEELGYVTIPVLSLSAFALIATLLLGARAVARARAGE